MLPSLVFELETLSHRLRTNGFNTMKPCLNAKNAQSQLVLGWETERNTAVIRYDGECVTCAMYWKNVLLNNECLRL